MRKKIVAGNWKMNKTLPEAQQLIEEITSMLSGAEEKRFHENILIILSPPFPYLALCKELTKGYKGIFVAAQNCHTEEKGAYTGEVSAAMIQSTGAKFVIIGHSERRQYFHENSATLLKKVEIALKYNLVPIFCIGEVIGERKSNKFFEVVRRQLNETVFKLNESDFRRIIIAYEPVWAIGTGLNATPEQAQEMHSFIRRLIDVKFGRKTAQNMTLLYGGSCNAQNARELFAMTDVDGGLIGGASLKAGDFISIVKSLPVE